MKNLLAAMAGICFLLGASGVFAQDSQPAGFTLDGVYYYLVEGTEAAWGAHSLEPPAGAELGVDPPGFTKSLEDIYYFAADAFGRADAAADDVIEGKVFFSTRTENWGVQTGTISTQTLSDATTAVLAGFYAETDLADVDGDLAEENIKKDVTIFGVVGTYEGDGGGVLWTGQTISYRTGDDGYYQKGARFSYQTDDPAGNGDILTIDNVTGLIWASDGSEAGCYGGAVREWELAIDWAEGLSFANQTDWRLPNSTEIMTLMVMDAGHGSPYINLTYFPNTVSGNYWSSTSDPGTTTRALVAHFSIGRVASYSKTSTSYVRAVRGGE